MHLLTKMKALVVGGTGLTGPIIVNGLIDRGYAVSILHSGRHESELIPPDVEHIHIDVHQRRQLDDALEGRHFDIAFSMHGRLREVADALKGHTERLITVGGECVYRGWLRISNQHLFQMIEPSPVPTPEEGPLEELGVDKFVDRMLEAEQFVMRCHEQGHFNVTHFRYTIGYGPNQIGPSEWSIVRRILDGRKQYLLPNGGQVLISRGFSENCAHGLLLAVDQPDASAGEIYNVCDETLLTVRSRVELIADIMGHEFEFVDVPTGITQPGYLATYPPHMNYPYHEVMSLDKIKTQLGYREVVSPERAMEITVNWLLENRPEPGGSMERNVGDSFDYAAEDRLIERLTDIYQTLRDEGHGAPYSWRHPYPHPKS
jgi:nucleoside-diphosphate-sugar epimerase